MPIFVVNDHSDLSGSIVVAASAAVTVAVGLAAEAGREQHWEWK